MESREEKFDRREKLNLPDDSDIMIIPSSPLFKKDYKDLILKSPTSLRSSSSPYSLRKRKPSAIDLLDISNVTLDENLNYTHYSPKWRNKISNSKNCQFKLDELSPQINLDQSSCRLKYISGSPLITPLRGNNVNTANKKRKFSPYKGDIEWKENTKKIKINEISSTDSNEIIDWLV
ncbi:unnamed protein product [Blepharisma stoltei]|uniref:Uncharacterized protein n=1 Tax=Blepharisma stoltei TaxID=1481888 RepID=A0AAU9K001_9CILI|nr:unnamed protein product [Blepharisma stoltei]